ncbi:MAG: ABC transporter ATP-binding protein [Clostridia bacterium]|nr:ABC transporter ATP-binding protein [Clostridia bacterium]
MLQLKWVWKNMAGKRRYFFIAMILGVFVTAAQVVTPKLTQVIIDRVWNGQGEDLTVLFIRIMAVIIGVMLVRLFTRYVMVCFLEIASQKVLVTIERSLFAKLVTQDPDFFDRNRTGDIITRATGDLNYIRHVIAGVAKEALDAVVLFVSAIVLLSTMHVGLTVAMAVICPLIVILTLRYSKYIRPKHVQLRNLSAQINTVAQENISGNRVVKAFSREQYEEERFEKSCEGYADYSVHIAVRHQLFSRVITFITDVLGVILIIVGGYFVISTRDMTGIWQLTLGELAAFSSMRYMLSTPLQTVANTANSLQQFFASADKVMEIYYDEPLIGDRNDCYDTKERIKGAIKFDKVSFSFGDKKIFENISFEIAPNETVAIMGPTGSGKTSLINLLARMYEPDSGHIYVDGVDVHMWKLSKLHSSIGVAMQDVFLFSDTIKGNISYGNPDIETNKMETYSKVADADGFIKKMDEQYDTVVGERGVGLSGGQRQRISLARALAVQPPILVLDDTTSAVDMETEKHIQDELEKLDFDCTKIIVAQRISSVRRADRIFILNNGKVEIGTHDELVRRPGYYREICKLQNIPDLPQIPEEKGGNE